MAKWIYEVTNEIRTTTIKGKDLWHAINDSSYGSFNPPIISDWIELQAESYMSEEWDGEYISMFMWNNQDYEVMKILEEQGYHPDKIGLDSELNRSKLQDIYKNIKPTTEEPNRKELFYEFIKGFDQFCEDKRMELAFERASEDLDLVINDVNIEKDDEVADCFGIKYVIDGAEIYGNEYSMEKIWICPSCGTPELMEEVTEEFFEENKIDGDGPFSSGKCYCFDCDHFFDFGDKEWLEANKHIDEKELIGRLI